MKTPTGYFITCDLIGCDREETYFPGQEEKMAHQGWTFIYPQKPKDVCDCKVLCPQHAKLASLFKKEIDETH